MTSLELRRLHHVDRRLLGTLVVYDREAFGPAGLREWEIPVVARVGILYVVELQEEIVGSCQLLRMADDPAAYWILGFYIRRSWQGRGFGRDMLRVVVRDLRETARRLVLTVGVQNAVAINLYLSFGFRITEEVEDFYGAGEDRYLLTYEMEDEIGGRMAGGGSRAGDV